MKSSDVSERARGRVLPSRVHALGNDPVMKRNIDIIYDNNTGTYPRVVTKPMATTFLLNRGGFGLFDFVAPGGKTPYPVSGSLTSHKSYVPATITRSPQYHKVGGSAPKDIQPDTLRYAARRSTTMAEVRAKLSDLLSRVNGG